MCAVLTQGTTVSMNQLFFKKKKKKENYLKPMSLSREKNQEIRLKGTMPFKVNLFGLKKKQK